MRLGASQRTSSWVLALLALGGCMRHRIDVTKLGAPKVVVVEDIPDLRVAALIGIPGDYDPTYHFSKNADYFYLSTSPEPAAVPGVTPNTQAVMTSVATTQVMNSPAPVSPAAAGVGVGVSSLMGALIQGKAEETQARAAAFHATVLANDPSYDLRAAFLQALQEAFWARGVTVATSRRGRDHPPRLRWPAKDSEGEPLPVGPDASSQPVDADLLVQVAPLAYFSAPGPLNAYERRVTVAVALYRGRTREFLGMQALRFTTAGFDTVSYHTYDSMVADIGRAAPALREALVSMAPRVADLATGKAN